MSKVIMNCCLVLFVFGLFCAPALAKLTPKDIEQLKKRGRKEGWTFEVGLNEVTQYDFEQVFIPLTDEQADEQEDYKRARLAETGTLAEVFADSPLPDYFDWRDVGGVTPVKDQGYCGSCWAFGAVGAVEAAVLIQDGQEYDFSEQWLVSCTGGSCANGGWHYNAFNRFIPGWVPDYCGDYGAVLEADFPYVAADVPCVCPYDRYHILERWDYSGEDVESIKQAIYNYGPVAVSVAVTAAFSAYTEGVFNACETKDKNHISVLTGWDDNQGTDGIWFLKNSHGPDWGEDGYMRIEYGCNHVGEDSIYVTYAGQSAVFPRVEAGPDMITWSGQAVQLAPTIIIVDGGVSSLTYAWSADPDDGVVFTPNDGGDGSTSSVENPTVTVTKVTDNPSVVTLTLSVNDDDSSDEDTMTIDVYGNSCQAALDLGLRGATDLVGDDCITNLADLAELLETWTDHTALTAPTAKDSPDVGVFTYDFEDGTLQGWGNLAGAAEDFIAGLHPVGPDYVFNGDYMVFEEFWDDRDADTNVSVLTSPMFRIISNSSVAIWAAGGTGAVATPSWTNYSDLPEAATTTGGFLGAALRRVSDGEYLLFNRRSVNGEWPASFEDIGWDADTLTAAVAGDSPIEQYVVDIIDTFVPDPWWGWIAVDDVTLTVAFTDPMNPSPADGGHANPASDLELSWTNIAPSTPGDPVYIDVWFGTEPDALDLVVDATTPAGEDADSVMVDAPTLETYYWQVNSYIYGSPTGDPIEGSIWRFDTVTDIPVSVYAGDDMITWSGQAVQLAPSIDDDGVSSLTIAWSADPDDGVVFTPNDGGDGSTSSAENPTVTVQSAYSEAAILNAGFEDPVLADGGWNSTFIDWTEIFGGGVAGVDNPPPTRYGGIASEGQNHMYASGSSGAYQVLTETLAAGTTYTLSVVVGVSSTNPIDYQVQLLAGGTVLAEDDSSLTIAEDTFETSTVTYASDATPAQLGEALEIRLVSDGSEVNFDDVRLTADPPFPADLQTVTLTLSVNDDVSSAEDTMTINVYDNPCLAAIGLGEEIDSGDFDADCDTDLEDYAEMAEDWLVYYELTEPVEKP